MADPPAQPEKRASDADREVVASDLRDAFGEGRLDAEEYQARLDALWQARTYGELDRLTADLPQPETRRRELARKTKEKNALAEYLSTWKAWAGVAVILVGIWFITGTNDGGWNFWPAWPLGIWALVNVAAWFFNDDDDDDEKKDDDSS